MSKNSKHKRTQKKAKVQKIANQKAEAIRKKQSVIPSIFLDESGNTGSNLLDKNQPVFTLASCDLSIKEAERLLSLVGSRAENELHFKRLKRNKAGQDGIIRLLSDPAVNTESIKMNVFSKRFMVTSKIVDLLIEHMLHLKGVDLYVNGQNIALSNMLFYCFEAFCNEELVDNMHKLFVAMVREQTEESIEAFYSCVEAVQESSSSDGFKSDIDQILDTKAYIDSALDDIDKTALDPSIPALFAQCIQWGNQYPKGFHLIHDDSHSIEKQREMFAQFMDWTQDEVELGYDRRKFGLPLKGKSMRFADSQKHKQIQVADIVASSFAYWAAGVAVGESEDYFFLELNKLDLDRFIGHNKIWPTHDVDPKDLGTVHDGGLNAANNIPSFLAKAKANPRVAEAAS
ncbi:MULTISPECIES: DUF3800 domain-containing protein [unclassified Vibrio]|uniref:DUF3800 domain-containing protein n=2 Tax=Vibrio TaxID=662 RepID=UPI00354CCD57